MNALLSALAAASVVLSYALYFAYRDAAALRAKLRGTEAALAESEAYRDAVKTAAPFGFSIRRTCAHIGSNGITASHLQAVVP